MTDNKKTIQIQGDIILDKIVKIQTTGGSKTTTLPMFGSMIADLLKPGQVVEDLKLLARVRVVMNRDGERGYYVTLIDPEREAET